MTLLDNVRTKFGWLVSPATSAKRLKAERGLLGELPPGPNAELVDAFMQRDDEAITWPEIQAVRIALLGAMKEPELIRAVESLKSEYPAVIGSAYVETGIVGPPTNEAEWRAQALSMHQELGTYRQAKLAFERMRSTVGFLFSSFLAVILAAAFWLGYVLLRDEHQAAASLPADLLSLWKFMLSAGLVGAVAPVPAPSLPVWTPLIFAGLLGAGFSVLARLYALNWSRQLSVRIDDSQALKKGLVLTCVLSLLAGVIAAAVMFLMFASGWLKGDLFPQFAPAQSGQVFVVFLQIQPASTADLAKLLLWAFVGGFSERLIPDKLKQLAESLETASAQKRT
ncbi:MAG: hypothetical protein JSR82_23800 [Verrucomicrobia bacterium]|nr:hypothetical protein [Verrucomicrobiota bacterium]